MPQKGMPKVCRNLDLPLLFGVKYVIIAMLLENDLVFIQTRGFLFSLIYSAEGRECMFFSRANRKELSLGGAEKCTFLPRLRESAGSYFFIFHLTRVSY